MTTQDFLTQVLTAIELLSFSNRGLSSSALRSTLANMAPGCPADELEIALGATGKLLRATGLVFEYEGTFYWKGEDLTVN